MAEVGVAALLAASGGGVISLLHGRLPPIVIAALATPAGAAAFLVVALAQLVLTGTVAPRAALVATVVVGVAGWLAGGFARTVGWRSTLAVSLAVLGAVAVSVASVNLHLSRLTPDSIDHLMIAVDLRGPEAMTEIRDTDMMKRQIGFGMLQTLADVTDRQYVSSVSPLFGASVWILFAWLIWSRASSLGARRRWALVSLMVLFVASTNRMVYHGVYVNIHMAVILLLFVAIVGCWLLLRDRDRAWAPVAGCALALILLFRPEAPLLIALVLVPMAASDIDGRSRAWLVAPVLGILLPWYGLLWRHAPDGSVVSPMEPVFGNILVTLAVCSLVVAGGHVRTANLARLADRWILWGLGGILVVYTASRPTLLRDTLFATANNLGPDVTFRFSPGGGGLWGVTWLVLLPLVAAALVAVRFPRDRLWRVSIIGFGYLYLLMPFLRGSPWRIGYGDSGNRIASHIVLVCIAYLVLALVEGRARSNNTTTELAPLKGSATGSRARSGEGED